MWTGLGDLVSVELGKQEWTVFDNIVQELIDIHVPVAQRQANIKPPWLNKNCTRASNAKRRLFRNNINNKTHANFLHYKEAEKILFQNYSKHKVMGPSNK